MSFTPTNILFPFEIFDNTKEFVKKIALQINGCYRDCYNDACAILLRRLIETIIIEIYISKSLDSEIKDSNNNYISLKELISKIINDTRIGISRQTKNYLPKIKIYGNTGAHSGKAILKKNAFDQFRDEIRLSTEDLVGEL